MIDWGAESEEIKNLVPEYFRTEFRPFLELYQYRNDKAVFIDYLKNSKECVKMDEESWEVLGKVTNSPKLINKFKNKMEEGKEESEDMCIKYQY